MSPSELFSNPTVPGVASAIATLTAAITDTTSTTITATAPPVALQGAGQFRILIDTELMIANYESSTWTVTRGAEGSTAATHSNSAQIQHLLTAGALNNLSQASELAEDTDVDISSPADGDTLVFSSPDGTWNNQPALSSVGTGPSGTPGANSGTTLTLPAPNSSTGYGLYWLTINPGSGSVVTLTLPSVTIGASFVVRATQNSSGNNTLAFAGSPQVVFPGVGLSLNEQAFAENWISFIGGLDDNSTPTWYGFPATSSVSNLSDIANAGTARYNLKVPVLGTARAAATSNISSLSGTSTIDGYATSVGDTVFLSAQTTGTQNGPWVVASGSWTRPTDYPSAGTLTSTRVIAVSGGTANAGSVWVLTETTDATITVDSTSTTWVDVGASGGTVNYLNTFGDGSDGSITLDGTTTFTGFSALVSGIYTLNRDVYATNLTVNNGVQLQPNGFRIECTGTLTNAVSGLIGQTPGVASGTNNATAVASNFGTIGTVAGAGGATGVGAAGSKGTVGTGGTGGAGTSGSAATAAAGLISSSTKLKAAFAAPFNALTAQFLYGTSANNALVGGTGGTAGSGDGTNKGGAGGAGATPVVILAHAVVNNGIIQSIGGPGGSPTTGNVGGGGGGSGGIILIYTLSAVTGGGSLVVTGGALGTGVGSGTNGGAGGSGLTLSQVLN